MARDERSASGSPRIEDILTLDVDEEEATRNSVRRSAADFEMMWA